MPHIKWAVSLVIAYDHFQYSSGIRVGMHHTQGDFYAKASQKVAYTYCTLVFIKFT